MVSAKRYFWLKLKDDFFNQKEIKLLRKIAGGDTYTIIYLKMLLISLKNNGLIYFDGITSNFIEEIALEIDEDIENVGVTFNFLQSKGLIEFIKDDEIELTNIASMVGSETDKASMMRRLRNQRKQEKLSSSNNVTEELPERYTEKEIEIDKELEIDKDTLSSKHDSIPYREIVEYLNEKTGSKFKHTTQTTRASIKTRFKEGYSLDDFKRVIDIKTSQWLYDNKMKPYLRPQTLFGTKFEAYLNERANIYQFEDSMKRDEKEPTPEEIAEFEKAREQFDKYKRTYAQNQS
ncbi:conserved phage C-terminal domain-containing protein [Globicatella sanguinis]